MKKFLQFGLLFVILLAGCKGASAPAQTPQRDTVYVKSVITYKVKITYDNGDKDTIIYSMLRENAVAPHLKMESGKGYFDRNPDNATCNCNNGNYLTSVRRVDVLSHD